MIPVEPGIFRSALSCRAVTFPAFSCASRASPRQAGDRNGVGPRVRDRAARDLAGGPLACRIRHDVLSHEMFVLETTLPGAGAGRCTFRAPGVGGVRGDELELVGRGLVAG
ncbi:MAG: hypothetical protein Kow0062_07120 [Acidobacteriota bacterium]